MLITDGSGNIIYSSMRKPDYDTYFSGYNFHHNTYVMHFVGNYACLESGDVFITTMPNNPNELKLFYTQDKDGILNTTKCPSYQSFVPLVPMEKMTLTKQ